LGAKAALILRKLYAAKGKAPAGMLLLVEAVLKKLKV